jgi:ABC-type phosphate/phosphonate transport system substrate-binding protein
MALLGAWATAVAAADTYVLTAPPRDSGGSEADVYQPVAAYLSSAIGKRIEYRNYDNWLTYQDRMRRGEYDIVFDGPAFIGWRMNKLGHEPIVRLPGKLAFVVMVKKDNDKIGAVKDLAGRTVCGLAPPNLATLTVLSQFDNPARQPLVIEVKSFKEAYDGVVSGKCMAAILRDNVFASLDKDKNAGKVVYKSDGIANQGFSVSPRVSDSDRAKIAQALVAPEAQQRMKEFFERYNKGKELVKATRDEYQELGKLLKDVWGFDLAQESSAKR